MLLGVRIVVPDMMTASLTVSRRTSQEVLRLLIPVFTAQMAVTALVASINPSINPRQNSGTDSEDLQQLQHDLLQVIYKRHPEAIYPAALCALADLKEVQPQSACHQASNSHNFISSLQSLHEKAASYTLAMRVRRVPWRGFFKNLQVARQDGKYRHEQFLSLQIASQDRAQEAVLANQEEEAIVEALRRNNEAQVQLQLSCILLQAASRVLHYPLPMYQFKINNGASAWHWCRPCLKRR